jgi:hypothetical protein
MKGEAGKPTQSLIPMNRVLLEKQTLAHIGTLVC